jgi:carboxylate-amine ligase
LTPETPPSAADLRATFDAVEPYTVGIEDELMLLEPDTFELSGRAREALALLDGDARFKLELPASQLEIITPPLPTVDDASAALLDGRRTLLARLGGLVVPASAGAHPFSPGFGTLNELPRYEHTISEYGAVARRQLVCALQVHVAVGSADVALAVYNASRSYLPLLAALAANAPFYEGRDTGLASVRPKLGGLLPRQGVPPVLSSWEEYADSLRWGAAAGVLPDPGTWWWELRLHRLLGTLEFRVPDGQTTVADAAAVAALTQALVVWLAERDEAPATASDWRIAENRWSACRYGVEGTMADLRTGARRPTRDWLLELIDAVEPVATRFGSSTALAHAREMVQCNGALAQRRVAAEGGVAALGPWLAERFRLEAAG